MRNKKSGFTLLIAVIFMSVVLTLGLTLASLGYKQQILASSAIASQYAFYAADAGLECALYADQQENLFAYTADTLAGAPVMFCDGVVSLSASTLSHTASEWVTLSRLSLDAGKRCVDVTIYKYSSPQGPDNISTYLFSQGYDVSCATVANPLGARFAARGIQVHY